jgi:transcriptional antiterminator NusG
MSESENAYWYVVHTYSGHENKVKANIEKVVENRKLHDLILDVRVPTEMTTEYKDNVKKEVERKMYPGYVLVKMAMTDESWYVVRNTRGVTGFVGSAAKAIPLTEEEVISMGVETRQILLDYKLGDTVRVNDGPLTGFLGTVEEISTAKDRVKVAVSMFGRETPVELTLDQVETLED